MSESTGCRAICSVYGFHVFDCPNRPEDAPEPLCNCDGDDGETGHDYGCPRLRRAERDQGPNCCDACPMVPTCDEMATMNVDEREFILSGGDLFGGVA